MTPNNPKSIHSEGFPPEEPTVEELTSSKERPNPEKMTPSQQGRFLSAMTETGKKGEKKAISPPSITGEPEEQETVSEGNIFRLSSIKGVKKEHAVTEALESESQGSFIPVKPVKKEQKEPSVIGTTDQQILAMQAIASQEAGKEATRGSSSITDAPRKSTATTQATPISEVQAPFIPIPTSPSTPSSQTYITPDFQSPTMPQTQSQITPGVKSSKKEHETQPLTTLAINPAKNTMQPSEVVAPSTPIHVSEKKSLAEAALASEYTRESTVSSKKVQTPQVEPEESQTAKKVSPQPVQAFAEFPQTIIARNPEPVKETRPPILEVIQQTIEALTVLKTREESTITISIKQPPMFAGATIKIVESTTAKNEFNITFDNLTPEARRLIETQTNQVHLQQALLEKGYTLRNIVIAPEITFGPPATPIVTKPGAEQRSQDQQSTDGYEGDETSQGRQRR